MLFDGPFLSGTEVVLALVKLLGVFDTLPGVLPDPCLPTRVLLAAEAVSVSRSWEADPKRTCSSISAGSENKDPAPPRRVHDSQHSLL